MVKLISFDNLKVFLSKFQTWVESKLAILDKKIDKQIFQGTEAELEAAIAAGLVDENTLIIITDHPDSPIYELCSYEDILNLFPEYKVA